MTRIARFILTATISLAYALGVGAQSDEWEVEVAEDHGHSHGQDDHHSSDELPAEQITVWQNGYEIFLEHTRTIAETPTSFIVHVTELETSAPRRAGGVEFILRKGSDSPISHVAQELAREGIYLEDLTFPEEGDWNVEIRIPNDGATATVGLPPITVFASEHDAHHASVPEDPEGVSFLKETQWKFPFRTEVWATEGSLPESSILFFDDQILAYVQVAGETIQARPIKVGNRENGRVQILDGLNQGDRVVTRGAEVVHLSAQTEGDSHDDHAHDHGTGHDHEEEGVVEVSREIREALSLTSEPVCRGDLVVTLDLYGWVRPRPSDVTELRAPISGVVTEVHVRHADVVEEGDALVTLESPEFLDWQVDLLVTAHERLTITEKARLLEAEGKARVVQLLGDLKVAVADKERIEVELNLLKNAGSGSVALREVRKREGELKAAKAQVASNRALALAHGVSSEALERILESSELVPPAGVFPPEIARERAAIESRLEELETEARVARKKLRMLSVSEDLLDRLASHDSTALLETLTLFADRSGLVTDLDIRVRTALQTGDDILHLIDYRKVYVEVEVPEIDIADVIGRASDTIPIRVPGLDNRTLDATVAYFDTAIDADIRKAHLVLEVDNVEGNVLRENMAVTVGIPLEIRKDTLYVPRKSVLTDGFEKVVFLDEGDIFHRVPIKSGSRTFDSIEVLGGLSPDQSVVVSGARTLLMAVNLPKGAPTLTRVMGTRIKGRERA